MNVPSDVTSRRRFLKLTSGAMVLIPLVNLSGCGGEDRGGGTGEDAGSQQPASPGGADAAGERQPSGAPQPAPSQPQPAAGQPSQDGAPGQTGSLQRLEESNPQAQALGYKHDAAQVDKGAYPQYQEGQLCSNCNLFQPELGEQPWGGCQIFPGKLVNADGWCGAYVPQQT